jgi:thiol-disulfide isomerase/thioredoxin
MLFVSRHAAIGLGSILVALSLFIPTFAQKNPPTKSATTKSTQKVPTVKQIDFAGLRKALTPSAKPLLVNFWATWCDPCREEFPDLVTLNAEYRGKIDFITISLDELSEINRDVPKFLADMKSDMPAYLLKALDDDAAIAYVLKDWTGALPLTILYDPAGNKVYYRQGKVKLETVRAEIDKMLTPVNEED